jgi:hypothetical protein
MRPSGNRFGLVLQPGKRGAQPALDEGNAFEGNSEHLSRTRRGQLELTGSFGHGSTGEPKFQQATTSRRSSWRAASLPRPPELTTLGHHIRREAIITAPSHVHIEGEDDETTDLLVRSRDRLAAGCGSGASAVTSREKSQHKRNLR